jgi:hypothetical protein
MGNPLSDLKKITAILLADESSYGDMRQACVNLLQFFYDVSGFDENEHVNNKHVQSAAGQAVSPVAAAVCIRDFMRTRFFMRGLKEAILAKLQANPGKTVTVLYAGTGPFATLLIPMVCFFNETQLNMVLLDINPASITYLNRIISYFKLEPYVLQVVETDAATYRIAASWQPDIILSETMKPSLKKEPQVSIAANLVGQCPQAILIPELIEVSAVLYNSKMDDEIQFIHLQTLLVFTKEQAIQMATQQLAGDVVFPVTKLQVQKPVQHNFSRLALLTYIRVFNNEVLGLNQSSLTIPENVYNLHSIKSWPAVFNLQYRIYPLPGFSVSIEEDNSI